MYKNILVPVDGSATSLRGLEEAIKLAKALGATLRIVHVVNELLLDLGYAPMLNTESILSALHESGKGILMEAEEVARKQGVMFQSALLETLGGRVSDLILKDAAQWPADLIVMGTHGHRGLWRLALGSDAEMVLRMSAVPVLLVRGVPEST